MATDKEVSKTSVDYNIGITEPLAERIIHPDDIHIDPVAEAKALKKCDWILVPLFSITFMFAFLDRSNIGNAQSAGLMTSLNMSAQQYANAVLFFYVTYVPFEVPGSLLVKKIRPSILLPIWMLGWSITCIGTGFMTTPGQFYASRLLIGIFESGMAPGLAITLTTFYTPAEQGRRFYYLYTSAGLAGAFGGLFAYGILQMDGIQGLEGWRWLFILEGVISCFIAAVLWVLMPDNPATAVFLNAADKEVFRLREQKHAAYTAINERFDKAEIWACFTDPKIYLSGGVQFFGDVISLGSSTFLPIIIKSFGFATIETQLLLIPVYTWGTLLYVGISFWSDRVKSRVVFMLPGAVSCIIGYALYIGVPSSLRGVLYFSQFFLLPGIYTLLGMNYIWMLNSHAGYYKRATAVGMNLTMGNAAGLIIGQIYKDKNSDGKYIIGSAVSLGSAGCAIIMMGFLYFYLRRQNRIRDALTPEERQQWIDAGKKGDAHPDFRFLL
ncbi:MFS transporter-2 [Coleophoma cylindrospora]|uniref:MFS transporter-2 n=1 Tax=Coleophoma cylindrospora TaxID=1849047 RepID=A0A3D8QPM5_9HELO|nr:MFS transporter-2 [Coleophoma cylindrospora]